MNKQGKLITLNGLTKVTGGIEWTKTIHPDGNKQRGYTWNVISGCHHDCRWTMPDGSTAICYAKAVAEGVAQAAYPFGFEHHYFHPHRLEEPLKVTQPARIFLDSMSDLMGAWVPEAEINQVLSVCSQAHWHQFQLLTKNAPRLLRFAFPSNVWVGVSSPPDWMNGGALSRRAQERMLEKALDVLTQVADLHLLETGRRLVTFMSFEPLSWDVAPIVRRYPDALRWAIIGAASNGRVKVQPEAGHVENLLAVLDERGCPVFFKGNLEWEPWRERFPMIEEVTDG